MDLIDTEKEIDIYSEIISYIKSKYPQKKIYFKPHPSEYDLIDKYNKLNDCVIITSKLSSEEILLQSKFFIAVGGYSTALISANIFFDLKVFSYSEIFLKNNINDIAFKQVQAFKKLTKNLKGITYEL